MKITVTVDEFGRLVLPKAVRTALGIFERMPVTIQVVGDKAELTAGAAISTKLEQKSGRRVYAGPLPEGWDSGAAVLAARARRLVRT